MKYEREWEKLYKLFIFIQSELTAKYFCPGVFPSRRGLWFIRVQENSYYIKSNPSFVTVTNLHLYLCFFFFFPWSGAAQCKKLVGC